MRSISAVLGWFALPAVFAAAHPAWWVYDRTAILSGEGWRLVTGNWVHFSASHLGWNLLVLLGAGACLEFRRPGSVAQLTLVGAPLIGLGLLAGVPDMQRFGGLSGLAMGTVTLLALTWTQGARTERLMGGGLLLLLAAKIGWEWSHPAALFSDLEATGARVATAAHVLGAVGALVVFARSNFGARHIMGRAPSPFSRASSHECQR